jgi:ADP-ribose pyrophosphatase
VNPEREMELRETLVSREVVRSGTYMTFAHDRVLDPEGREHGRDVVLHPGAVTVVAILSDRRVMLVRQYRHAAGEALLELPAGTLDRQPDGSLEEPLPAAQRELWEETGHRAMRWHELARFFTAPGFSSELMTLYLATGVERDPTHGGPDPDERLVVVTMPFQDALALAGSARIRDAKTIVGLYMTDALARAGQIPELSEG